MDPKTSEGQTQSKEQQSQGNVAQGQDKTFSQAELDRIVQDRLNRDRQKYADYDDLRKRVEDYEKQQEKMTQLDLENKKEYEKLKEGWTSEKQQLQNLLDQTRNEVKNERISNTLNLAITKNNAYPEAAQLLRSFATYHDDGTITVRGKDANGMETDLPIEKGVEQFLKDRPYLVRGSGQGGGNTSGSTSVGNGQQDVSLARQLENAMAVGNRQLINELKNKIRAKHSSGAIVNI